MRCVYAAVYVYGAAWNRMELAHRQTEAHGRCGVMRGLAVAVTIDRPCTRSVSPLFAENNIPALRPMPNILSSVL